MGKAPDYTSVSNFDLRLTFVRYTPVLLLFRFLELKLQLPEEWKDPVIKRQCGYEALLGFHLQSLSRTVWNPHSKARFGKRVNAS